VREFESREILGRNESEDHAVVARPVGRSKSACAGTRKMVNYA
jgi:hypothetical protein